MQNLEPTETFTKLPTELQSFTFDNCWFNDGSISDMDYFIKTLSGLKGKQIRPDLIGSIITHYASKWLPELSDAKKDENAPGTESITSSWTKKKFFIETIIGILPPDRDFIPCDFLLRLLRAANMVRVEPVYHAELEKRTSWQLDQASLKELMIPCFGHDSTTLFDVGLVFRLVRGFMNMEDQVCRSGAAAVKVAKLVDCYLAEAAVDAHLALPEFFALASVVPSHARSTDDGLYRAVDTYLKAHPGLSKQEKKQLCSLIDSRKLSQEASLHAAQNDRMPVRAILHLLLSEQTKLNKHIVDWSGPLSGPRSPIGLDMPGRCFSKRETGLQQQMEIKRLKEDVLRLQSQCMVMERQIEKMFEKKRSSSGLNFSWKKLGLIPGFKAKRIGEIEEDISNEDGDYYHGLKTPSDMKARLVRGKNRRKSLS
ncbi:hypothetical protein DH2020_038305 [Rehmannia glutinosa]|uniref:NPH3 domain-containing protein n=1 Tax=Rehmannia glutinosa TaxID=99300 RepID=A0ABR0UYZ1_REHGL